MGRNNLGFSFFGIALKNNMAGLQIKQNGIINQAESGNFSFRNLNRYKMLIIILE
jgi:hypothetical protein